MGSTNKTSYLNLNQWTSTDKPIRMDFVEDNRKIDDAIKNHVNSSSVHITSAEKEKINSPFSTKIYSGNGESSINVSFDFDVNLVFIYKINGSQYKNVNSKIHFYSGVSTSNSGASGIQIIGSTVVLSQEETADGDMACFNELNCQYTIIAFR